METTKETIANYANVPEIEISYKSKVKPSERVQIISSLKAAEVFRSLFDGDLIEYREEFLMLLLNRANKVIGFFKVSSGGVAGTVVDPKMIFSVALKAGASSIMIAHNHPSGNMKPSIQDLNLTRKIVAGGKLLEISVLDHIILSGENEQYYSFADEGLI